MAKRMLGSVAVAIFALAVIGGASARAGEPIELSFGHYWNPGHDLANAVQKFADSVAERSGGRLVVSIFPSSQLGTGREMMEQCSMGTLDLTAASPSDWATSLDMPELAAFELPFLYKNLESQKKLITEILSRELPAMLEGTGLHHILAYANGIRNPIIRTKPIHTLEDLKGLKIRCPETNLFVELWKGLGSNIVISPWAEVYSVLSQGVADAIEADAVGLINMNLQEVGKYYSRTAHMGGIAVVFMNGQIWDSLPVDLQKIVEECAVENEAIQIANRQIADDEAEKALADAGILINDVSDAERGRMRQAVIHIHNDFAKKYNRQELVDTLLALDK